ncbi:MAG: diguanylate cyclase [Xanthobacteraceae bacterium]|jgi:diguanylate cyclase (GGDEF)-like protein|nr:diguanylate cyclase [Xanthobacteraceae bacterium]
MTIVFPRGGEVADSRNRASGTGALSHIEPRARRTSLRHRLIALVGLGLALLIAERVASISTERDDKFRAVRQHVLDLTDRGMGQYMETLSSITGALHVATLDAAGMLADPRACGRLERIVEMEPGIASLAVVGPNGIVACSSNPAAHGLDIGDREYMQIALRGVPNISGIVRNVLSGNPSIMAAQPVIDDDGNVTAVLVARIDLDLPFPLSIISELDLSAAVLMVDPRGTVIMAYPDNQQLAGQDLSATPLVSTMLGRSHGTTIARGPDGVRRIYGFRRLPASNMRLAVGLDAARVMEPVNTATSRAASIFLAACALIFVGLWFAGERLVVRPVQMLAARFARFGRGETEATTDPAPRIVELEPLIDAFSAMSRQLTQREMALRDANSRLSALVGLDPLTAVANRRAFDQQVEEYWDGRVSRIALLMIDVDKFKEFNDRYGHGEGDTCLRRISAALVASVRGSELVARLGGEEFAVLMPDSTLAVAEEVATRLRRAVEMLDIHHVDAPAGRVTVSVGVAACGLAQGLVPSDLLAAADKALYAAKHAGRNAVRTGQVVHLGKGPRPARSA